MFGHHSRKRDEKRYLKRKQALKESQTRFDTKKAEQEPGLLKQQNMYEKAQIEQGIANATKDRETGRAKGREYAKEVAGREVQGLNPNQRKAMQYEANRHIDRNLENTKRELLGNQSRRGVSGGVRFAQEKDLHRQANESRGVVHRDLDKLNADMMEKRRAQDFGIEQGEAAQHQLDRQIQEDRIDLEKERKRQREFEDRFHQQFNRL